MAKNFREIQKNHKIKKYSIHNLLNLQKYSAYSAINQHFNQTRICQLCQPLIIIFIYMEKHSAPEKKLPVCTVLGVYYFKLFPALPMRASVEWLQKAHNKVNNSQSHCQRSSKLKVSLWEKLKTNKLEKWLRENFVCFFLYSFQEILQFFRVFQLFFNFQLFLDFSVEIVLGSFCCFVWEWAWRI